MSEKRLATMAVAAKYMGCNPRTVRRRIDDGTLVGYRVGPRLIRVDLDEVDQFLERVK